MSLETVFSCMVLAHKVYMIALTDGHIDNTLARVAYAIRQIK